MNTFISNTSTGELYIYIYTYYTCKIHVFLNKGLWNWMVGTTGCVEVMVSRMTLILYLLQSKMVFYCYEQPGSSILWNHPRMEAFINCCDAYRCWTWMGAFGGGSPKGTTLWSSRASVHKLSRALPNKSWDHEMTKKSYLSNGKLSVSGGRDLKRSQAYTPEFGFSTLSMWLSEPETPKLNLDGAKIPNIWAPLLNKKDRWDDAHVVEVMQYLTLNWPSFPVCKSS